MFKVFPGSLTKLLSSVLISGTGIVSTANELEEIGPCRYVATDWADGDSFLVKLPDGSEKVFRLYFVDCIEQDVADMNGKRRLREQARHFGVADYALAVKFANEATKSTTEALGEPFTIHTSYATAPGRSGKPRFYAFVTTAKGEDLGESLVERGLARAFGLGRATPSGIPRDDWEAQLTDLELVAALRGRGLWKFCDAEEIVAMRRAQREELRALEAIDDALVISPPSEPVDVNSASLEDLMRTGLRESLADEVVKNRPFRTLEELDAIRGIGPATLEKIAPYLKFDPAEPVPARKPAP